MFQILKKTQNKTVRGLESSKLSLLKSFYKDEPESKF